MKDIVFKLTCLVALKMGFSELHGSAWNYFAGGIGAVFIAVFIGWSAQSVVEYINKIRNKHKGKWDGIGRQKHIQHLDG